MQEPAHELVTRIARVLRAHEGIRCAILFGSQARGTARPDSDVDIGVEGSALNTIALSVELSTELGRDVDVVALSPELPIPLLRQILRDGKVVYERFPHAGEAFRSRARWALETDGPGYDRMRDAWLKRVASRGFA